MIEYTKRLNKKGRGLFGTKMYLMGMGLADIAEVLEVKTTNVPTLLSRGLGMLHVFDTYVDTINGKTELSGMTICDQLNSLERTKMIYHIDITIARKGDKLFTTQKLKGK